MSAPAAGGANVIALLAEIAGRHPDRPALVMEQGSVSFGELWRRVDRASAGMRRLGLEPGDRAIVMIPMSIDLYVALLGLLKMGAVAVFVDPWIGARQIAAFAAFAEPRAYFGIAKAHLLRFLAPRLRRIPIAVTAGRRVGPWPAPLTLAELEAAPGDGLVHPAAAGDSALITFTSGSSGEPKGADRTHGFLLAQHRALAAEFPSQEGDVDMPMFPVFALNNLASGVPSVIPALDFRRVETVDAARVRAQMAVHGVTTCTASPPFFDRLARDLEQAERAKVRPELRRSPKPLRSRLRRILTGGAPVSDAQLVAWRLALPETEVLVVYGSTEAEPVAHVEACERLGAVSDRRPASPGYCVGTPTPLVRARAIAIEPGPVVLGAAGWSEWEVAPGEVGELVVTGDHVCRGYYRNPGAAAANKIVDSDGTVWHRMGDTGYFDGRGRFWLTGRVHSTLRRQGGDVHPQLVEQAATGGDPRIRRAAAVGLADPELGERAVLVLETAAGDGSAGLVADVERRLESAGLAVDEIVRTEKPLPLDPRHRSKIDYPKLRRRLERRRGR
jgi:acyl-CoA synthetase (AMP-forming)/AMP-acid ligase II